jgi:hypothetical protein
MLYESDGATREDDLPFVRDCFGRPEAHAATHRHVGKPAAQGTTIEHSLYVYVDCQWPGGGPRWWPTNVPTLA